MAKQKRGGLGRGLDALYEDNSAAFPSDAGNENGTLMVRLSSIEPNRGQPRKSFDEASLSELADSIREHGILQPLLVRRIADGTSTNEKRVAAATHGLCLLSILCVLLTAAMPATVPAI